MKTQYGIVSPLSHPFWDELLLSREGASFFHSSHWARVICTTYAYTPLYFAVIDHGRMETLVPVMEVRSVLTGKRGISLPFTDFCDPLVGDGEDARAVLHQLHEHGCRAGWKYIEFRGGELFRDQPSSVAYYGHVLDLAGDEREVLSRFRESTRRNINRAAAGGVKVRVSDSLESIREYYRLHCMTRRRHGLPPQPPRFFDNLYHGVLAGKQGIVVLASHGGVTIAGAVYFHLGDKAIYKFGASDVAYQHLRPNYAVMWEAVRYYCGRNYSALFFGRTDLHNKGLRQYKNGWGTREYTINYYKYDLGRDLFAVDGPDRFSPWAGVISHIPLSLLRTIGNVMYKHMG